MYEKSNDLGRCNVKFGDLVLLVNETIFESIGNEPSARLTEFDAFVKPG